MQNSDSSFAASQNFIGFCMIDAFVKFVVAHHHRGGAATGETFDEFDRELSVLRRLRAVRVRFQAQLLAKVFVEFIRAAQRAAQRPADLDLIFAHRLLLEHRIKRHEFVNVDGLQIELPGRPLDRFLRNPPEMFLDGVQHHERCCALDWVMRN